MKQESPHGSPGAFHFSQHVLHNYPNDRYNDVPSLPHNEPALLQDQLVPLHSEPEPLQSLVTTLQDQLAPLQGEPVPLQGQFALLQNELVQYKLRRFISNLPSEDL
jgi:hypothetical protein